MGVNNNNDLLHNTMKKNKLKEILEKHFKKNVSLKEKEEIINQIFDLYYSGNKKNFIDERLLPISDYLISIVRDTDNGWYTLKVGIPSTWEIKDSTSIGLKVTNETDVGKIIEIFPKKENVIIDDLIIFVEIIIKTNIEIVEMEKVFIEKIEGSKNELQKQIESFYDQLKKHKEKAFINLGNELAKTVDSKATKTIDKKDKIETSSTSSMGEEKSDEKEKESGT